MPKQLTDEQLTHALGKRPARVAPSPKRHEEYDPEIDGEVEQFLDPANRPTEVACFDQPSWPPKGRAGEWANRIQGIRLLGGSEELLPELPSLLSCVRSTHSETVKHHALRAILTLIVPPEWRAKVSEPLLSDCVAAINENSDLAFNPHMANGSPDWVGLVSGAWTSMSADKHLKEN
jgi:hypothetical protein